MSTRLALFGPNTRTWVTSYLAGPAAEAPFTASHDESAAWAGAASTSPAARASRARSKGAILAGCNNADANRHVGVDHEDRRSTPARGAPRPGRLPRAVRALRRADPRVPRASLPQRGQRARAHRGDVRAGMDRPRALPRRGRRVCRAVAVRHRPQRLARVGAEGPAGAGGARAARHAGRPACGFDLTGP